MWLIAIPLFVLNAEPSNILVNGGFDDGLSHWQANMPESWATAEIEGDRSVAQIAVPPEAEVGWPHLYQEFYVEPHTLLELNLEARQTEVASGYGVYAAIDFYAKSGDRISYSQSAAVTEVDDWESLSVKTVAPDKTAKARVGLIVNGHGTGRFDNVRLANLGDVRPAPLEGPVTITVTQEVVCDRLFGFGAEDDGWFYNDENKNHGVDDEAIALREGRIRWMDPDYVRMFFWMKDWCPSGDWKTLDFDSPNMLSHYRTLEVYQQLGARVNLTNTEWGVTDPYGDPQAVTQAFGALLEHLIKVKGYSCIQDWTLSNEPNGYFTAAGYSFDRFVELHALMDAEFTRRGLALNIVGADDAQGFPWFQKCVASDALYALADYYASHRYFPKADRYLVDSFYDDRLEALATRTDEKPFIVAEFGFHNGQSGAMINPIMKTYPYAVWTASFVIAGLNRGVAGHSIWCLQEIHYPGDNLMQYGLWDSAENGWAPRPVYHAFSMFPRLTEPGMKVYRCDSSHPRHVSAARVGDTLFFVNESGKEAELRIEDMELSSATVMTESTLSGDRECGKTVVIEDGRLLLPPQSFGHAH